MPSSPPTLTSPSHPHLPTQSLSHHTHTPTHRSTKDEKDDRKKR